MRILLVGSPFTDFIGRFGLIFRASEGFRDLGHEIAIATTDADCFFFDKEKSELYARTRKKLMSSTENPVFFNGIPVYSVHCTIPRLGLYCPGAEKFAKKIIKNFDVVHLCVWYNHITMVFAKVASQLGIPFVVSSWGSLLPEARNLKKREKWVADQIYTKKYLMNASAFHSVGKSDTEEFIRLGAKPERIFRIDNPVVLKDFEIKERTNILKKYGLDKKDSQYILFLGRINEKKGIEILLQAFEKLNKTRKNLILIIAGSGTKDYVDRIKNLAHDLKINDSVKFTGLVSENEKLELLESAKLFALTSHSDVHPIAVQDSLTMGLPVVITEACDYPEVEEYNAGIIVNSNIDSIYNAIEELLANENKIAEMSENAKRLISERFLLKHQIKKYEEMYLDAIKK